MMKKIFLFGLIMMSSFFVSQEVNAYVSYENQYMACKKDGTWQCILVKNKASYVCKYAAMDTYNACLPNAKAAAADEIKWYVCPTAQQGVLTCSKTKTSNCGNEFANESACKSAIESLGGTFVATQQATPVQSPIKPVATVPQAASPVLPAPTAADLAKKFIADEAGLSNYSCVCEGKQSTCADKKAQYGDEPAKMALISDCQKNESCKLLVGKCSEVKKTAHCICGDKTCKSFTYQTTNEKTTAENTCAKCEAPGLLAGSCSEESPTADFNLQGKAKEVLNPVKFSSGKAGVFEIMSRFIQFDLFPLGMFAMALYIWAGFLWMTSSGNSENVTKAKSIITWVTVGIVAVFSSYLIIKFVFTELFK